MVGHAMWGRGGGGGGGGVGGGAPPGHLSQHSIS